MSEPSSCNNMRWVFYLLFALLIAACQFAPDGTPLSQVSPPNLASINLTSIPDGDTLFLSSPTQVSVSIQAGAGQQVVGNYVVESDTVELSFPGKTISFTIDPSRYATGIHKFTVIFQLNSATQSMASKLGVEFIWIARTWYFEIYNDPPPVCPITKIEVKNGGLNIHWTPYGKPYFGKYVLETGATLSFGGFASKTEFVDPSATHRFDSSYIGGYREYRLIAFDQFGRSTASPIVSFDDTESFRIIQANLTSNGLDISWNRTAYDEVFKAYAISLRDETGNSFTNSYYTESINDTTAHIGRESFEFGIAYEVFVHLLPRTYTTGSSYFSAGHLRSRVVYQGERYQGHTILQFVPASQSIYTRFQNTLFRLHANTLDTLATRSMSAVNFAVSPNGQYVFVSNGIGYYQLNPATLQIERSYTLSSLTDNRELSGLQAFTLSDNNLLSAFGIFTFNRNYLIDLNTGNLRYYSGVATTPGSISHDGTHYFDGNKLYRIDGPSTFTLLRDMSGNNQRVLFNPNYANQALILTPSTRHFERFDLQTATSLGSFTSPYSATIVTLDPSTNLLLIGMGNSWSVHNWDGALHKDLGVSNTYLPYALFNGKLFRGEFLIPVDQW